MEVERKFRLKKLPDISLGKKKSLTQSYLFSYPGELRVRKADAARIITIKGEGDLARNEWESVIPEWAYLVLLEQCKGNDINKTRHQLDKTTSIDVYHSYLDGLIILEVEFSSVAEAKKYKLPKWATGAVEVTDQSEYKNKQLYQKDSPPDWPNDILK